MRIVVDIPTLSNQGLRELGTVGLFDLFSLYLNRIIAMRGKAVEHGRRRCATTDDYISQFLK